MAAYKPWRDKSYLHRMYVEKRKTMDQIVEDCKSMGYEVTPMSIWNNLKKFDLLRNARVLGKRSVGGTTEQKRRGGYY